MMKASSDVVEEHKVTGFSHKYSLMLFKYKYIILVTSYILILLGMYLGYPAFSSLREGGFSPPKAESTKAAARISQNLAYPEYTIVVMVEVGEGSSFNDPQIEIYYSNIQSNLANNAPVVGVIGYYDYPWQQERMISDDGSLVLIYATIAGSISNEKLVKVVDTTPLTVYCGGTVPFGQEMSDEILSGVEIAEFGSLPILLILLVFTLGGVIAGVMPFYGRF